MKEIEDMLGMFAKQMETSQMSDEDTANKLREAFALRTNGEVLKPGMIVVHKYPEYANTKNADRPAIFVRYLTPDEEFYGFQLLNAGPDDMGGSRMAMYQNCLIMRFSDAHLVEFLEDAAEYKPHPDFIPKH